MTLRARRALLALAMLVAVRDSDAQDTASSGRHKLALDTARLQPFRRVYDMIVHTRDSIIAVGEREVALTPATYAGNPAWMIVESRGGLVPAVETLYVAPDARPLQWTSLQGQARLGATFVGDTIFGAIRAPSGRPTLVIPSRPDLLVSQPMIEALLPLLPLSAEWTDSVSVLAVDMAGGTVIPAELSVIGEEETVVESALIRPTWVLALRAEARTILFWIDKETGEAYRVQQPLPPHVGSLLEFRRRVSLRSP